MTLRSGNLKVGDQVLLPQDREFAVWSTKRTRDMTIVPRGVYECVWMWEAHTGEGVATLTSPKLHFQALIVDTFWGHTPGRNIMTLVPFLVGDTVKEIKTGKVKKISQVFLHVDHCEHHYKFEGDPETVNGTQIQNMRWHHELQKVEPAKEVDHG